MSAPRRTPQSQDWFLEQCCVGSSASGLERAYLYRGQSQAGSTTSSNGDGLVAVNVPQTTSSDGLAGSWTGSLSVQGGETYLVNTKSPIPNMDRGLLVWVVIFLNARAN